jgi:hypothetical protein
MLGRQWRWFVPAVRWDLKVAGVFLNRSVAFPTHDVTAMLCGRT